MEASSSVPQPLAVYQQPQKKRGRKPAPFDCGADFERLGESKVQCVACLKEDGTRKCPVQTHSAAAIHRKMGTHKAACEARDIHLPPQERHVPLKRKKKGAEDGDEEEVGVAPSAPKSRRRSRQARASTSAAQPQTAVASTSAQVPDELVNSPPYVHDDGLSRHHEASALAGKGDTAAAARANALSLPSDGMDLQGYELPASSSGLGGYDDSTLVHAFGSPSNHHQDELSHNHHHDDHDLHIVDVASNGHDHVNGHSRTHR